MSLDFTAFNLTLQGLLDSETDPKQLLLIAKSLESAGNHGAFEARVSALETQLTTAQSELTTAQSELTTAQGRITELEATVSKPFLTQYVFGAIHG